MKFGRIDNAQRLNNFAEFHEAVCRGFRPHACGKHNVCVLPTFLIKNKISEVRAQPEPRNRFAWLVAQNAYSGVRKCLHGGLVEN
jgi:hypothetical protein